MGTAIPQQTDLKDVTAVSDVPLSAGESYSTSGGTTIKIAAPGVLGNDTDGDGDPLTAQLVSNVSGGTLTLNADGSFRYMPRIGFSGADTFTYRAHDGTTAGNTVTVSLRVPGGNAPITLLTRKTGAWSRAQ